MADMVDFSVIFLNTLADFLGSEPIIYLFVLILLCYVCRVIKIIIH